MIFLTDLPSERILKLKKHPRSDARMNYERYEHQIIDRLGVQLKNWPLNRPVCQPGKLSIDDAMVLRDALAKEVCHWEIITHNAPSREGDGSNGNGHTDEEMSV